MALVRSLLVALLLAVTSHAVEGQEDVPDPGRVPPLIEPDRAPQESDPGTRQPSQVRERPARPFGSPPLPHERRMPARVWA